MSGSSSEIKIEKVIPIDPDGRYLLMFPEETEQEELIAAAEAVKLWWESDQKFLVVSGGVKLKRVDD